MSTARIIAACDAAAALLLAGWTDRGADDGATRDWIPEIALTEDPGFDTRDLRSVRVAISGGAVVAPSANRSGHGWRLRARMIPQLPSPDQLMNSPDRAIRDR